MTASQSGNVAGEPVGALNRVFPYLYRLRLKAKALRQRSRRGYYALKWSLMAGLLFLILR